MTENIWTLVVVYEGRNPYAGNNLVFSSDRDNERTNDEFEEKRATF